ncbi:MAG: hypothetical protein ACJ798_02575 [Phenylobacterium sp.]
MAWVLAFGHAGACRAQAGSFADIFSPDSFHGLAEVRAAGANGERSWLDHGFGKTSVSGDGPALKATQAALEWKPAFSFAVSGDVTLLAQSDAHPGVDLGEAFLKLKAPPTAGGWRFSARAGVFYPPVSLENDGTAWTPPDMLSASALNSWIGEEVKVAGVETTLQQRLGGHEVEATVGVFGWDDTAGTLLTFRGWALHDVRTGVNSNFALPPLSPFAGQFQPDETYPFRELDGRPGYYGRIEWRPPAPVALNVFFYDNGGNRIAVDSDGQWAWETRFFNAGLRWQPTEEVKVLAQALNGETIMGYPTPGGRWFDMGFQAAYVLVSRKLGDDAVSGRIDGFRTKDRTFRALDDNQENGWAVTASWRHRLAPHADLIVEAQHVASKRNARRLVADDPKQDQTILQTALRLSF